MSGIESYSQGGAVSAGHAESLVVCFYEVLLNMNSFLPAVKGKVFQRLGGNCKCASLHLARPDVTHVIEHASQEAHVPSDTGKEGAV